jgi:hypothetical protein
MKYFFFFLLIVGISGCSVVNKQYYYVPETAHHTLKTKDGYFKMLYSQIEISGLSGDSIGSISTSNGIGEPLLAGPPFLPFIPVGLAGLFYKREHLFIMDFSIKCNEGYFMLLAIDSNGHKRISDSLSKLRIGKAVPLNINDCYMIINNSKKIPLHIEEFFMGSTVGHSYRMIADTRFGKVNSMKLVTGNAMLDSTLKKITFKRKHRITYCLMGPS